MHWTKRHRLNRAARLRANILGMSARNALNVPRATERRILELKVLRGTGQRLMDRDNLLSSLKGAIDGIVDAGWLVDDTDEWCDMRMPTQEKVMGEPRLIVTIRPLPGRDAP